jgi:predicted nucleic acid-binding protein
MKAKKMIISDATTLIVLEKQRKLSLLCQLFEKVIIPETVYQELMAGLPVGAVLDTVACIEVETVALSERLANLLIVLDQGEAEAIELAISKQLPLIIDEKKGRKIAQQMGLIITGLAGLLILAVKKEMALYGFLGLFNQSFQKGR